MNRQYRRAPIRAVDSKGTFTARAVSYGVVDSFGSVWAPGCFNASLGQELPIVLFAHDVSQPIGRGTAWKDTPQGPEVTARLDVSPDVPLGRQAYAQLQSGTLTDCSVGFNPEATHDPTTDELRMWPGATEVIDRACMLELSIVYKGAVPGAEVLALRSKPINVKDRRSAVEASFRVGQMTRAQYELEVDALAALDELDRALLRSTMNGGRRADGRPARAVAAARTVAARTPSTPARGEYVFDAREILRRRLGL